MVANGLFWAMTQLQVVGLLGDESSGMMQLQMPVEGFHLLSALVVLKEAWTVVDVEGVHLAVAVREEIQTLLELAVVRGICLMMVAVAVGELEEVIQRVYTG
jgi:hypothetical protein